VVATYQDVVAANSALAAWSFTEASGLTFGPYIGGSNLVGTGAFDYQQAGPFAASFGLRAHVGARASLVFVAQVVPPFTTEAWFKLASATPATLQILFYFGNTASNGSGLYVNTAGHIVVHGGGRFGLDTGILWPDTNWHQVQMIADQSGVFIGLGLDGLIRWRNGVPAPNSPSPNTLFFFGDSTITSPALCSVAMAALYAYSMSPGNLASSFLAATDPTAALAGTLTSGGSSSSAPSAILAEILASVKKTY
jgi:hypothetical protein